MCASYTDITGSPVANATSSDFGRAGSYYGGNTGGGIYTDGYQSTANPQRVLNSEFSRQPGAATTIQTTPPSTMRQNSGGNVAPAVITSSYYSASAPTAKHK